ncbi:MAG: DUF433 domain-containing protein [Pyrinomonadaceae bacterium]
MSSIATVYEHIVVGKDGVPRIDETNTKVIELVLEQMAYGWSPEEIHLQHLYLSLGQIHSALAYYWDHKKELDRDIERRLEEADMLRQTMQPSPLIDKLKAKGLV